MVVGPGTVSDQVPIAPDPGSGGAVGTKAIEGRSLGRIAWNRLKSDKVAMTGGAVVIFLILVAIFAPVIVKYLGDPPNEFHQDLIDPNTLAPIGGTGISADHLFGVEPLNGRDIFSRVVYGARISLLIAFLATLLSVLLGSTMGVIAGFFGGWVDSLISRLMTCSWRSRCWSSPSRWPASFPTRRSGSPATRCGSPC